MGAKLFLLTQREIDLLNKIIKQVEGTTVNPPLRPATPEDNPQAPGTYIAWPPSGGIPALTFVGTEGPGGNDQPGSATCDIYKLDDSGTTEIAEIAGLDKTVYNFSEIKVPRAWTVVTLLKGGQWVVAYAQQQARKLRFAVNDGSGFAATDASVTVDTVTYHDGVDPPSDITTVYNEAAATNYIFSGADDARGKAEYFPDDDKYYIYQMECP